MNDDDIERVLKAAGMRERAPADVEREVREHLRQEWREIVAERRSARRRWSGLAIAASILVAAFGFGWRHCGPTRPPIPWLPSAVALDDVRVKQRLAARLATGRRRPDAGGRRISGNGYARARCHCHAGHRLGTTRPRHAYPPCVCRPARHRTRRAVCGRRRRVAGRFPTRGRDAVGRRAPCRHAIRGPARRVRRTPSGTRGSHRMALQLRHRRARAGGRAADDRRRRGRPARTGVALWRVVGLDRIDYAGHRHRRPAACGGPVLGRARTRPRSRVRDARGRRGNGSDRGARFDRRVDADAGA